MQQMHANWRLMPGARALQPRCRQKKRGRAHRCRETAGADAVNAAKPEAAHDGVLLGRNASHHDASRHRSRRPAASVTFIVLALLLLIVGPLTASRTQPTFFPRSESRDRGGLAIHGAAAGRDAGRISTLFPRALTTTDEDIEHIEANSYAGIASSSFFQPGVNVAVANAQVTAIASSRPPDPAALRRH